MYRLVFLSGRYEGKRLMVRQALTLVGSHPECHLVLPAEPPLAPRHARFEERGSGIYLTGLAPDQPVLRNGAPVLDTVRLAHNDQLELGGIRIQFQEIIAPHKRLRPSPGLLQPVTGLLAAGIVIFELALLAFLVDWPSWIIRPDSESRDLAWATQYRAAHPSETNADGKATSGKSTNSVMVLPGTEPAPPAPVNTTNADGTVVAQPAPAATTAPPAIVAVLDQADFTPADTNLSVVNLPPVSAADPVIEEAQRALAEAVTAAQFADYAKAFRLLNQIHQNTPGFLPAHVEHARLLETRGELDEAHQRWTQILGIAPAGSPFHQQAIAERQRLARLQALQTQILQTPAAAAATNLPRNILIASPDIQKMPADTDIAEMRVLNATLELAPDARLFKDAFIQVYVTFYDIDQNNIIYPTHAIVPASPIALGSAFADRRSLPFSATYVVPHDLRAQELRETGRQTSYYGYTLHVFAGQILQDAAAKPKKLLDRPIHIPRATEP